MRAAVSSETSVAMCHPLAIIGAGSVGSTLGRAWIERGEDVIWGLRNPADPKYAALPKGRVKAAVEAVKGTEIVVIATPWSAAEAAIKSLAGKIVIDCMNPLAMGSDRLQLVLGFNTHATSARMPSTRESVQIQILGPVNRAIRGDRRSRTIRRRRGSSQRRDH
jgi:pyrroline-5-carboxylate reductase